MITELLPRPFCGGKPQLSHDTSGDGTRYCSYVVQCVDCNAATDGHRREAAAIRAWNEREDAQRLLLDFYKRVCLRAETNMMETNTVSGAHWNAMRQVLAGMGIEVLP